MIKVIRRRRRWTRPLGLVLGAGAVLVVLAGHRIPAGSDEPGAQVTMVARSLGEFTVKPVPPFLVSPVLYPGSPATSGSLSLSNISPKRHLVRIKPVISNHDLDRVLQVVVLDGETVLFDGALQDLETRSLPFMMDVGQQKVLKFTVALPITVETSVVGRSIDIEINLNIEQPGPPAT
ncbi:MAG: hypothetical protein HYR89_03380 [Actinobacteria bacterium]|nr:hypothetical protein [Actinomycetota bacterium]